MSRGTRTPTIVFVGAICLLSVIANKSTFAATLLVPSQYPTIQAGIDAAVNGDTVLVAPGTYTTGNGDIGWRSLDFNGKAITVKSESGSDYSIIDCENAVMGFSFHSGEDANSVLDGFTIVNGHGITAGALFCMYSNPKITNCVFKNNVSTGGGGMGMEYSSPLISNCKVIDNKASSGGGIGLYSSQPVIKNCIFSGNLASREGGAITLCSSNPIIIDCSIIGNSAYDQYSDGGGIKCWASNPTILNCTICGNHAVRGAGISSGNDAMPTIVNCIVWDNSSSEEIYGIGYSISYSKVRREIIDTDPCFADPRNGDYHLTADSPCVDAGDPNYVAEPGEVDLDGRPRVFGGRIDMGAYEFVPKFSLSVTPNVLRPANHKMVKIAPTWTVRDDGDSASEVSLVGITCNDKNAANDDIQINDDGSIYLRAEKDRVYTITYKACDESGNCTTQSATVTAPRDNGKK